MQKTLSALREFWWIDLLRPSGRKFDLANPVHERILLKKFLGICITLLFFTWFSNTILASYGPSKEPVNKTAQVTPTLTPTPSLAPTLTQSPSVTNKLNQKTCGTYRINGKTIQACATCGNNICEAYETCTSSSSGPGFGTEDCGKLYCPKDCEKPTLPPMTSTITPSKTACPLDAKLCPDGKTYVGRTGPDCAFAACPKQ